MAQIGGLAFSTSIDTSGFEKGTSKMSSCVQNASDKISSQLTQALNVTESLEKSFTKLGAVVGVAFSLNALKDFAAQVKNVRAEIQSLEISFETLLGSKEKADALFGSIRKFAVETPMQLKDLASAAQMMLSFNIEEDKIMPYLKAIGDISMGDAQKFGSLSLAFSQMSSAGRLMGQDLMQMINAGFNPLSQIAEKTGKSIADLKKEMESGAISAKMVQQAFIDATSEGGKYNGMLEKMSQGLAGAQSNLQGAIDDMLNEMGEATEGVMTTMYSSTTEIVKNWRAVAEAIAVAVTSFGAYKAVLMATAAIQQTMGNAQYEAEAAELTKVIALKEADANADLTRSVAAGKITKDKANEIIALREEAKASLQALQAKAMEAKADVQNAVVAENAAKKRWLASVQNVKSSQLQLAQAQKSGDAFAVSAAQANLDAAAIERDAAAKAYDAAVTNTKNKRQIESVATTNAEAAATIVDTAATTGDAAATSFLVVAKNALIAALKRLYAAMMANPYALAAAAIVALGYAIYKLVTYQSDSEKAQKRLNKALEETSQSADLEAERLRILINQLKKAKEGTEEYSRIKKQIQDGYGQYLGKLDLEKAKVEDLEAAYNDLSQSIRKAAMERGMEEFIKTEGKEYTKDMGKYYTQARDAVVKAYGEQYAKEHENEIKLMVKGEMEATEEFLDGLYTGAGGGRAGGRNRQAFRKAQIYARERTAAWNNAVAQAEYKFTDPIKEVAETETPKTYKQAYEEAEAAWKEAKKKLDDMSRQKDKFTQAEYEQAKKDEEKTKKTFKELGGKTDDKSSQLTESYDTATEKLTLIERKQQRERKRLAEDVENEIAQATIDAMDDASEAVILQRELNFKKEQQSLQRELEDAIDAEVSRQKQIWDAKEEQEAKLAASQGRKYTKKAFDSDNLSGMEFKPGQTFEDAMIGDVDMAEIYTISLKYGALLEALNQKQAHAEEEAAKRQTEAMNEYLRQWGTTEQKKEAITAIYEQKIQEATTEGEKLSLTAQMNKELSDLELEANKKTSAIAKLFGDMSKKSIKELRSIASDGEKALKFLQAPEYDKTIGEELGISEATYKTLKDSPEQLEKIRKALLGINQSADNLENPLKKIKKGLEDIFNAKDKNAALPEALKDLGEGLSKTLEAVSVLSNAFASLGDAFGSSFMSGAADVLNAGMDAANGALQGAKAGAVFGIWGATAGAAIGLVGKLGSALSKLHDAKYEKTIVKLQEKIDVLKESYDSLGRAIEKAYSKKASGLIEEQNQLLLQQRQLIRQQINEEKSKKKTDENRIKEWENQIKEIDRTIEENKEKAIDAIFGSDIKNAIDSFANAYESMFDGGISKAKASKNLIRDMLKNMVVEAMKSDISKPMEALRLKMAEFWADGFISNEEESFLATMAEKLMSDLETQYKWADKYFNGAFTQQGGSSGGFTAMSQETGSELSGRFSAMQISMQEANASLKAIVPNVESIQRASDKLTSLAEEMSTIGQLQLTELQAINKRCKMIHDMSEELLTKIERNTKNL